MRRASKTPYTANLRGVAPFSLLAVAFIPLCFVSMRNCSRALQRLWTQAVNCSSMVALGTAGALID